MSVMENNRQEEVLLQYEEIFRLISRMNQIHLYPGQKDAPEFAEITDEVKFALARIDADSPAYEALLSTYRRMMRLPTHTEDVRKTISEKDRDVDQADILKIFR